MKLYLSSYRIGNKMDELKSWINQNDNKILVIPNATDLKENIIKKEKSILDKCQELENLGFDYKILDLRDYFGKKEKLVEEIKDYRAFYVLGGNVFALRIAMKLSGFDEYLKKISRLPNYLYSGYSAGICVLAKDLHGLELVDDCNKNPYGYDGTIWEGIGLVDYLPIPHYDSINHPEYHLIMDTVKRLDEQGIVYKTIRDGEVIVEEIK